MSKAGKAPNLCRLETMVDNDDLVVDGDLVGVRYTLLNKPKCVAVRNACKYIGVSGERRHLFPDNAQ